MFPFEPGVILRLFIGESDTHAGRPLHRVVLEKAQAAGLTMAGVFRAERGYGASRQLRAWVSGDIPPDFPLVVEMVGGPDDIRKLVADLDPAVTDGLVTLEKVQLRRVTRTATEPSRGGTPA
jgi:hypothetical protein